MKEMGMTDGQFKSYVRFLLDDLQELKKETNEKKKEEKLDKVIENLQKSLED